MSPENIIILGKLGIPLYQPTVSKRHEKKRTPKKYIVSISLIFMNNRSGDTTESLSNNRVLIIAKEIASNL